MRVARQSIHILQPTSLPHARPDPWELLYCQICDRLSEKIQRTDNQRNHGGSISSGRFKTPDELLDLPNLDVLLGLVRRWVGHDVEKGPSTTGSKRARIRDYVCHKISCVFAIGCRDFSELFWSWIVASSAARCKLCGTHPSERERWLNAAKKGLLYHVKLVGGVRNNPAAELVVSPLVPGLYKNGRFTLG